jgi:hypothetical protein
MVAGLKFRRGTDIIKWAVGAVWISGETDATAVKDEQVRNFDPTLFWYECHQILFNLCRI